MNIKIRNGIEVQATGGLIVEQAWLQYASGPLVRDGNIINLGEKINLHLIILGWKGMNDQISIGASEKIVTDEGQYFLNEADLFARYDTLPLEAVQKISLSAVIENIDRLVDFFRVDFRIYSKTFPEQEINGYYLFHI
ncbi:hypothetical protein G6R40_03240 [Chryseobacterium sp. POL2]|uniref:hypothetical protein n=1 Tax=Chryseobacterium sp. POL2 TaxID=2713414 RepID=UPI0013E1026A|nr:hypothetical protein [Chryseobacterium sp. POL2]QIG88743.1 hypothetical protein G6R40_03240 [Chryseobacterium sp. POL2]